MAFSERQAVGGGQELVARLAAADGAAVQPFHARLLARRAPIRDLADAAHALCAVHGHHPGLIELVAQGSAVPAAQGWLDAAALGFAAERAALAKLVAAAGPLPSTPGQAQSESALTAERHALEMLARSERAGVGLGAALALALDWRAWRQVIDAAADRFGVTLPPPALPAMTPPDLPGAERAIGFGAQQLFAQHRGLLGLLEARSSARG